MGALGNFPRGKCGVLLQAGYLASARRDGGDVPCMWSQSITHDFLWPQGPKAPMQLGQNRSGKFCALVLQLKGGRKAPELFPGLPSLSMNYPHYGSCLSLLLLELP